MNSHPISFASLKEIGNNCSELKHYVISATRINTALRHFKFIFQMSVRASFKVQGSATHHFLYFAGLSTRSMCTNSITIPDMPSSNSFRLTQPDRGAQADLTECSHSLPTRSFSRNTCALLK
ncbi:hypothetical protein M405DRAFT_99297 [Rhizopogon salebrosus TDB-379]|nr:hypothetical protein M405DRAFT_99297 [Rhizopogon salebrosus TDB-379]